MRTVTHRRPWRGGLYSYLGFSNVLIHHQCTRTHENVLGPMTVVSVRQWRSFFVKAKLYKWPLLEGCPVSISRKLSVGMWTWATKTKRCRPHQERRNMTISLLFWSIFTGSRRWVGPAHGPGLSPSPMIAMLTPPNRGRGLSRNYI